MRAPADQSEASPKMCVIRPPRPKQKTSPTGEVCSVSCTPASESSRQESLAGKAVKRGDSIPKVFIILESAGYKSILDYPNPRTPKQLTSAISGIAPAATCWAGQYIGNLKGTRLESAELEAVESAAIVPMYRGQ
jgi:hypothetical protein